MLYDIPYLEQKATKKSLKEETSHGHKYVQGRFANPWGGKKTLNT